MSVSVEKLPDEPIILVTIRGEINVEIARDIYQQIAEIAAEIEGPIYRITDLSGVTATFLEIVKIVQEGAKGTAGSLTDPRIKNVFVGDNSAASLSRDLMAQARNGGRQMPLFASVHIALEAIRLQLSGKIAHSF